MPETLEELNLLLLTVATPRKVHRDGIRCHGLRYLALTLTAYVGEEVTVRYDPCDLAEIRVFNRNDFLCVAVSPERKSDENRPGGSYPPENSPAESPAWTPLDEHQLIRLLTNPAPSITQAPPPPDAATPATAEEI